MNHSTACAPLVLVPNTLDLGVEPAPDIREALPDGVLRQAAALTHWLAEDARTTRAFLKRVAAVHPLTRPLQEIHIRELPRPRKGAPAWSTAADTAEEMEALLRPALEGHALGLISEAGLPGVADPGAQAVAAAHRLAIPVQVLPGPSALVLALAASGLNGQNFAFVGYLPQESGPRQTRIRELEALSRKLQQTQLFIETPYRNTALLQALLAALGPATRLSVGCGLTLPAAFSRTLSVSAWRALPEAQRQLPDKTPAVFAILASGS